MENRMYEGCKSPRVSVIMPAYNVAQTIEQAIVSVQAQTVSDWELIVVDDGSADDTASIVVEIATQDPRIRLICQENGGVSAARNTGLAAARGEYISFLDGDDLWYAYAIERLLLRAEEKDADFVYGRTEERFPDGKTALVGPVSAVEGFVEDYLHGGTELRLTFHISAMLIRRTLIQEYELSFPFDVPNSEDTAFFLKLLSVTRSTAVTQILSTYIRRGGSATDEGLWCPSDWEWQAGIFDLVLPFVREHRPQAVEALLSSQAYRSYRFALSALRHGFVREADEYIARNYEVLVRFVRGKGKYRDRMKCCLLLKSPTVLRVFIAKL